MEQSNNIMTLTEIRKYLANICLDNSYKDWELMDIYMDGFIGYNNETDEAVVDEYIYQVYPDNSIDDKEPIEVLAVTDESGSVCFSVVQHENTIKVFEV